MTTEKELVYIEVKNVTLVRDSKIAEFPDSSKSAAAKLKLGDIFLKQEKWADAKSYYTDVADNYTGAQGQLARKGLDKIKKAGH